MRDLNLTRWVVPFMAGGLIGLWSGVYLYRAKSSLEEAIRPVTIQDARASNTSFRRRAAEIIQTHDRMTVQARLEVLSLRRQLADIRTAAPKAE